MAAKIKILCVGKLKEKWQSQACEEYAKRICRYAQIEIVQVKDRPDEDPSAMAQEGEALLRQISPQDFVVALAIGGKSMDSPALADFLSAQWDLGQSLAFVIGGSNGLDPTVLQRANRLLSFSDFTFPHGLMRVILLEQLYRACTIHANHPYHK